MKIDYIKIENYTFPMFKNTVLMNVKKKRFCLIFKRRMWKKRVSKSIIFRYMTQNNSKKHLKSPYYDINTMWKIQFVVLRKILLFIPPEYTASEKCSPQNWSTYHFEKMWKNIAVGRCKVLKQKKSVSTEQGETLYPLLYCMYLISLLRLG